MNRIPERLEAHCPRCNAAFVTSTAARRRKIQCPKCRQTVSIGLDEPPLVGTAPSAEEFAELQTRLAQQAALIEQLSTPRLPPVETPVSKPPPDLPPGDSLLRPGHSLRWLRRETLTGNADADQEQHAILLHNLHALGRHDLAMEEVPDDPLGQRLAERLSAIFREAGWSICPSPPSLRRRRAHGLILTAAQCPLPRAATATYMALKAAGFAITSRIDSTLGPEQSILIAGSNDDGTDVLG